MKKKTKQYIFVLLIILISILSYLFIRTPDSQIVKSYNGGKILKKIITSNGNDYLALSNNNHQLELYNKNSVYELETIIPFTKKTAIHFYKYPTIDYVNNTKEPLDFIYSYSLKENGKEEARWFITYFTISDDKLVKKWSSDFQIDINVEYQKSNFIELSFTDLKLTTLINLDEKPKLKHFLKNSLNTFHGLHNLNGIILTDPTYFRFTDYNNDGYEDIIMFTPIYYLETNTYLTSICTIWEFSDHKLSIIKNFCIQENEIEGQIIKIIADYKNVYKNEILQKLTYLDTSESNLVSILNKLSNNDIITHNEELYYIPFIDQ